MATTKKKARRKRASASQTVVRLLKDMPHGELARLPAALVAVDADVARFLMSRLAQAIPHPTGEAAGTGEPPDDDEAPEQPAKRPWPPASTQP